MKAIFPPFVGSGLELLSSHYDDHHNEDTKKNDDSYSKDKAEDFSHSDVFPSDGVAARSFVVRFRSGSLGNGSLSSGGCF